MLTEDPASCGVRADRPATPQRVATVGSAPDAVQAAVDVSIVIVNWNTRQLLQDCLRSIYTHAGRETFEILVVDNGSSDGSADMVAAEFPGVQLICNGRNLGFAAANNQGLARARGRYALLLNSDTRVLAGTIARSLAFADAHRRAGIVGCRTTFPDGQLQPNCYQMPSLLNLLLSLTHLAEAFPRNRFFGRRRLTWWGYDTEREVEAVAGCFMLVRRQALQEVGPLAEDYFMYSEDTDWCWRFRRAGWRILYTPQARLIHLRAASSSQRETQMRLQERCSLLMFLDKQSGRWVRRIANLMFLGSCVAQVPILGLYRLCGRRRSEQARRQWPLTAAALRFHLKAGMRSQLRLPDDARPEAPLHEAAQEAGRRRPVIASGPAAEAGMIPLHHEVLDSFEQAEGLQAAWDDLARRCGDLMSSWEWCRAWWRYFGRGRRLAIHTLRAGGRLVGVLPLFHERLVGAAGLRVIKLVGCEYTIDAAGLAIEPPYATPFVQRVLGHLERRDRWDALYLGPLRSYAAVVDPLAAAAAADPHVGQVFLGTCDAWQTLFDLPDTYDEYIQNLSGDERRDTARRERNLRQGRQVRIEPVCKAQDVPAAMDAVIRLHQQLWTGRGRPGQFGEFPEVARFHRHLAQRLVRSAQLALVTVTVDGQVVAAGYGYHFGSRTHTMFRGYRHDPPWRGFALGRLVHCRQARQAIEQGSRQMEDGRGVFEYKRRLNGRLGGERSLWIVRNARWSRLAFQAGLRAAYLLHVLYGRIWLDLIHPRLRLRRLPWHAYIRCDSLAKLFKRTRRGLSGGPVLWKTAPEPPPS